jgi:hypothetical protein
MSMTTAQRTHYHAAHLLALCASGRGETMSELAEATGMHDTAAIALARRTLVASLGHGRCCRDQTTASTGGRAVAVCR